MRVQGFGTVCFGIFLVGLAPLPLTAQSGSSTQSGVYTALQAQQGEALYGNQCAMCHGAQLEGAGQNPSLTGNDFLSDWQGQTLADLFTKIHTTMPATNPGSLTPEQTTDLMAFIMKMNKMPAGTATLSTDPAALKSINIVAPKATPQSSPATPQQ